jgi:hypothetical protein
MDTVPDTALVEMRRNGRAYTHEVRSMADELIALRAERKKTPEPITDLYFPGAWITP